MGTGSWDLSDAWILAAVGPSDRGTDLQGLLAAADHYNHAIPNPNELSQAVGRLAASGLVTSDATHVTVTPAGQALWQQITGGGYRVVEELHKALAEVPLSEGMWPVSPNAFRAAYRRYSRWGAAAVIVALLTWWLPWPSTHGKHERR